MGACWVVGLIAIALPFAVFAGGMVIKPDSWGWWLIGSGALMIVLIFLLAQLPLESATLPTSETEALDLANRVRRAYSEVCDEWIFAVAAVVGAAAGYGIGKAIKNRTS